MSDQPLIKCSVNTSVINKTKDYVALATDYQKFEGTAEELLEQVIFKGHAMNQSLFLEGKTRSGANAEGGNLIVLDLDDGLLFDQIKASPTYQRYGCFIYASASCGVVAPKKKVDGRERWRVGFLLEREVKTERWTEDETELRFCKQRQHLERIACAKHIADNFCADAGIPKLEDNCHNSVSQPFFGNDGATPIPYDHELDTGFIEERTYPCSTEKRFHINNGFLPAAEMELLAQVYKERNPQIYEGRKVASASDQERELLTAMWLLDNDIFTEDQLTNRDICIKELVAYCRNFGDDLFDSFMGTMERVMDGHDWRLPHKLETAWKSFSVPGDYTFRTFAMRANEADPDWKSRCPYTQGGFRKYPVPRLSEAFSLLRSTNPINIII